MCIILKGMEKKAHAKKKIVGPLQVELKLVSTTVRCRAWPIMLIIFGIIGNPFCMSILIENNRFNERH